MKRETLTWLDAVLATDLGPIARQHLAVARAALANEVAAEECGAAARCTHPPCRADAANGSLCLPCAEWLSAHPEAIGPCDRCVLGGASARGEEFARTGDVAVLVRGLPAGCAHCEGSGEVFGDNLCLKCGGSGRADVGRDANGSEVA